MLKYVASIGAPDTMKVYVTLPDKGEKVCKLGFALEKSGALFEMTGPEAAALHRVFNELGIDGNLGKLSFVGDDINDTEDGGRLSADGDDINEQKVLN